MRASEPIIKSEFSIEMNTISYQPVTLREQLVYYALLARFDKPIGVYLLLWPTLWALWIAGDGNPDIVITLVFVCNIMLMRTTGCIINDYADRHIDGHVYRTQFRPLATGAVSSKEAVTLFCLFCFAAFLLVLLLNTFTILLSFIGVFLAFIYPFTKRFTYMPQVFLGLAFGWSIPMAFAAQSESLPQVAWLLLTANVLWATAYDTMYAMVDREDDLRIGVKSTAILFGEADRIIIGAIQAMFLLTMLVVGNKLNLGWIYYVGLAVAAALTVYQQFLIKEREPEQCFLAFLNNNWLGAAIFLGILGHYWLR